MNGNPISWELVAQIIVLMMVATFCLSILIGDIKGRDK